MKTPLRYKTTVLCFIFFILPGCLVQMPDIQSVNAKENDGIHHASAKDKDRTAIAVPSGSGNHHASITVNAGKMTGATPYIFRASSFLWWLNDEQRDRYFSRFLSENKVGTVAIKFDSVLEPSISFKDFSRSLSKWDDVVRKVTARGGEIVFEIWSTPMWLSKNPDKTIDTATIESKSIGAKSPPRDYEEWSRLIYVMVDHFNNKLKADARYQVWAEPDIHWLGSEEEYFQLYKYSVKGARQADPGAKIGGPAVSAWDARARGSKGKQADASMLYNFIKFCSENGLPELGLPKLPIDFIVWHQFNMNPFLMSSLAGPVAKTKQWLSEAGYSRDTELFLGEWNSWQEQGKDHPYFSPEHDTHFNAAYIIAALDSMKRAGIDRHAFATLFDFDWQGGEFLGNLGMVTKSKIIKPAYNAFRAAGMLGKTLIETEVDDDFIIGLGSAEDKRVILLLANFFPLGNMSYGELYSRKVPPMPEYEGGFNPERWKKAGVTDSDMKKIFAGEELNPETLKIPAKMQQEIKKTVSFIKTLKENKRNADSEKWRTKEPVSVTVNFKNLPFQGEVRYRRFLVDSGHSNSFSVRKKVETAIRRGHSADDINDWPEVKLSAVDDRKTKTSGEFTAGIVMEPYSVHVLVLAEK